MEALFLLLALIVMLVVWAGTDLTVTAASVQSPSPPPSAPPLLGGETGTAGMSVYLKSSTNKWMKAQCDGTAEEAGYGVRFGVLLNAMINGQPAVVQESGIVTIGATVTVGVMYCISDTYGGICPIAAVPSGSKITIIGIGATSGTIDMAPKAYTGYAVP